MAALRKIAAPSVQGPGDHHAGYYYNLTGHEPDPSFRQLLNNRRPLESDWPFMGSVVAYKRPPHPYLPQLVTPPEKTGFPEYPAEPVWLDLLPPSVVDHFVGVGNPFSLGEPQLDWTVLDIGCGAGFDSQMAARYVGPTGKVIHVDLSEDMLGVARQGVAAARLANPEFRQGLAEKLPVESSWADVVISNGVLNLATCKDTAFWEAFRVLKPGGRFQAADLVLVAELPEKLKNDEFAWSN